MKKVLILGSGLVARPIIQYLLSKNYRVTVASNTPDRSETMINGHPNGRSLFWEAGDEEALGQMISDHDIAVSLLPYVFHVMVARHCITHRKSLVTTSYVKPEMLALDQAAREAGIILLNEIGLDPGIDHMSAMRIIDHVHTREGAILEFYSICGALPAPEAADNPFRYKFSWSPKGVVLAGNNDATFLKHGKVVSLPTESLFKDPFSLNIPELGRMDVYPNRDSIMYRDLYGIPEAQTMFRGTFRYPGWCETLDVIKKLGLISQEKFDMTGMTYASLIIRQIGKMNPGELDVTRTNTGVSPGFRPAKPDSGAVEINDPASVRKAVARFLGTGSETHALDALRWLGLFDHKPMERGVDSTFEVTSDLMIEKMALGTHERDMVVMQHIFLAGFSDGRKEVIRSRMLDFGTLETDTSIARTVALPAAIGVDMILNGQITITGVHIPVIPEIYNPVLKQLEHLGIRMIEEYGLPLSEMIGQDPE